MLMEGVAMTVLTIPVLYPMAMALGFDPIWFLLIFVMLCEVAVTTPPVGFGLYIIESFAPQIPLEVIIKGALPFVLVDFTLIGLLIAFPQMVLLLPNLMR